MRKAYNELEQHENGLFYILNEDQEKKMKMLCKRFSAERLTYVKE